MCGSRDVLYDIDTGKVLISTTGANGRPTAADPPKLSESDAEAYEQVTCRPPTACI